MNTNTNNSVDGSPVKSFFVEMLTRDIELVDAVLDLLDNCVDGILRQVGSNSGETPYKGYEAEIKFDAKSFSISDNCGGIPQRLQRYAFRLGRESENREADLPMIGTYGIGMKRAIFKIGTQCSIVTQSEGYRYNVDITPEWLNSDDWDLPMSDSFSPSGADGTTIDICELNENIALRFSDEQIDFTRELTEKVQTHYAFILEKGFQVKINDERVIPEPTRLIFDKIENGEKSAPAIRPYIFQAEYEGVDIFLSVGFTMPIPSEDEIDDEQKEERYSSENAGWTIICNDRAVLYHERTELTGWGEATVPKYHTQFIAISGIVEFKSNDPSKLPTTTTKRGIDATSPLYLQLKNRMREGMKTFTTYTYRWKGKAEDSKKHMNLENLCTLEEIKKEAAKMELNPVKSGLTGQRFMPELPMPDPQKPTTGRISYSKDLGDIQKVQKFLFGDEEKQPSEVGEACFDEILEESQ